MLLERVSASSSNVTRHRASAHIRHTPRVAGTRRVPGGDSNLEPPRSRGGALPIEPPAPPLVGVYFLPTGFGAGRPAAPPPLPSPDSSAGDLHRQGSGLRNALGTAAPAAHEMSLALCVGIPEHATSPGVSLSPAAIHPVSLNPTASPPTPCSVRGSTPPDTGAPRHGAPSDLTWLDMARGSLVDLRLDSCSHVTSPNQRTDDYHRCRLQQLKRCLALIVSQSDRSVVRLAGTCYPPCPINRDSLITDDDGYVPFRAAANNLV